MQLKSNNEIHVEKFDFDFNELINAREGELCVGSIRGTSLYKPGSAIPMIFKNKGKKLKIATAEIQSVEINKCETIVTFLICKINKPDKDICNLIQMICLKNK